jgi:hypothetical protein
VDLLPPDAFLSSYPTGIHQTADELRAIVKKAVPNVVERVRTGWRLIGYDVPLGKRYRYFAWVAPELAHVHLGFQYGAWMADPEQVLRGAHLKLRKVRYLTFTAGQEMSKPALISLTREAARVAAMSPGERMAYAFDRNWEPDQPDKTRQRVPAESGRAPTR